MGGVGERPMSYGGRSTGTPPYTPGGSTPAPGRYPVGSGTPSPTYPYGGGQYGTPPDGGWNAQANGQSPQKPPGFWERYGSPIVQAGGMVVGGIIGKKAQENAMQRSPEELAALQGAQGIAGQAGRAGGELLNQGRDYLQRPAQYFQTLLGGNRAAMAQAVAGPTAQITSNYRGASRALDQQGVRGAARDQAVADLNRQRAGQIAGLTTGMQPYAAEQLASMGQNV